MRRWNRRIRRNPRQFAALAALAALTAGMLGAGAVIRTGYPHELLVNVGAGLGMVLATFLVLEPLIRELRKPDVEKHSRLDFTAFFDRAGRARSAIAILETGTHALSHHYVADFREALATAFRNDVEVRILLLDPDSPAAVQRTEELAGRADIRDLVMTNLRNIHQITESLPSARRLLHVRLYSVNPSVQMYRWDDKAYLSFYPVGRRSDETEQLEIFLASPWGQFVQERFRELWSDKGTRPVGDYFQLRVRMVYDGRGNGERALSYVWHDNACYVPISDLGDDAIFGDSRRLELHAGEHRGLGKLRLDRVGQDEADTVEHVARLFHAKYGRGERAVVRLIAG
ncbi:hypothetical protein [Longispora albida]|uniref:hypothetical protein n=1 Tax=Longispora albida TaxID=203523 RepID=UPI0012FBD1FA|nr:hypothetical protein [Longispora albida]